MNPIFAPRCLGLAATALRVWATASNSTPLIAQGQGIEGIGKGEDDVKVFDREQFRGAVVHPLRAGRCLALGTMPVAAGVVGDALELALVARFDMAAESCGTTGGDGAQDTTLLAAEVFTEPMAMPSNDLRQFQRRALKGRRHGVGGVGGLLAVGRFSRSSKLGAAVSAACERCRYNVVVLILTWPSSN